MRRLICSLFLICLLPTSASAGLLGGTASSLMSGGSESSTPDASGQGGSELAGGLIGSLTKSLGVSEQQAEGGTGALMQLAKSQLSGGEFSKISTQMPGMETLLAAAPALAGKSSGSMGGLSGVMGSMGGVASSLSGIAKVTEQFEALGLDPAMISQFADLIIGYFRGGEGNTAALLEKGLGAALNL